MDVQLEGAVDLDLAQTPLEQLEEELLLESFEFLRHGVGEGEG